MPTAQNNVLTSHRQLARMNNKNIHRALSQELLHAENHPNAIERDDKRGLLHSTVNEAHRHAQIVHCLPPLNCDTDGIRASSSPKPLQL